MSARVRIGAVKLKGGAELRIFRNDVAERTAYQFDCGTRSVRKSRADDMAGFAVVAWGITGAVSVDSFLGDGRAVNPMNVASFVAAAITDQRTRVNTENDMAGNPTNEDGPA